MAAGLRACRPRRVGTWQAERAKPDQRTLAGETALIRAAARGDVPIVTALLAAGADPRITLQNNVTALTYAEQREDRAMIDVL